MRVSYFLLGAFIGAPVRYVIVEYLKSYLKFPLGILLVNVIGSFLLGIILESETNIAFALMGFSGALLPGLLLLWTCLSRLKGESNCSFY